MPETTSRMFGWIIRDVLMHVRCDDDAMISALGIGGITCNPFQITSQANKKSCLLPTEQVDSAFSALFLGSQPFRVSNETGSNPATKPNNHSVLTYITSQHCQLLSATYTGNVWVVVGSRFVTV